MAQTSKKELSFGGFYERMREYEVERTALFGLIRWAEVVHTEKVDNSLVLRIETTKMPTRVLVNGEEYKLLKLIN